MATPSIQFPIGADAKAFNSTFDKMDRRIVQTGLAAGRFGRALADASVATGINRVATGISTLNTKIGAAVGSLGKFAPAMAGITGAASIAGMGTMISRWSTFGFRLGYTAQRIGMGSTQLQGLQNAARLAGASADDLSAGMSTLQDNLTNAAAGRDPQFVSMGSARDLVRRRLGACSRGYRGHARAGRRHCAPDERDAAGDRRDWSLRLCR